MTKLVQPNVLRAYQSGEQYAINELVLYNSVPAYTNTALAQGVAGTAGNFTNIGSNTFSDSLFRIQDNGDATKQIAFQASGIATGTTRTVTMPNVDTTMATSKFINLLAQTGSQTLAIGGRYALPVGWNSTLALSLPTGTDGDTIEIADPYNVQRTLTGGNGVYVTPQVGQYIQYSTTTTTDIVGDLRSAFAVLLTYSATNTRWELSHISRNVPMDNTDNQEYYQNGALVRRNGCLYVPAAAFLQSGGGFVGTEWVSLGVHKEAISANKTLIINSSYYMRSASPSTPYTLTLPEPYTSISYSFNGAIIEIDCLEYTGLLSFNTALWTNAASNGATNGWRQGPDYEADLIPISSRTIQCAKGMKIRFRKVQIGTVHYWFIDLGRPSDSAFSIADSTDSTKLIGFNAGAIQAGERRVVTMPDANVNLGTMSSVATTDFNDLSGTRNRIVGGSHNTVSGTDNVVVMGTSNTLNTSEVVVEGADWYNTTLFPLPRQTVKSSKAATATSKRVIRSTVCLTSGSDGIGKYATVDGTQTLTSSYLPKAVAYDATKIRRATHKITAMVHSDANTEGGFFERIVLVTQLNAASTVITASKIVVTDTDDFGLSYNYGLTITLSASAGDALLKIVGTCTSTPGGTPNNCSVSCVVESIYHIDS